MRRAGLEAGFDAEVIVIGAGPVGLFLACCLAARGVALRVIEARASAPAHSRAISIHPPALERLGALGLAEALVARGVVIRRGHAFANTRRLGTLDFGGCPPPYSFILSLPQYETEALLCARLEALAPGSLSRGLRLEGMRQDAAGVTLELRREDGRTERLCSRFVAGCDGKTSRVREAAGSAFRGGPYPDRYWMGDFADHTAFGADAAIYLCDAGLVESFPLPGGRRRWVLKLGSDTPEAGEVSAEGLCQGIRRRLGEAPDPASATMLSAFGVERYLAAPLARGRALLAGDAAHLLSPIGGQGMNLGWLGAWDAALALRRALEHPPDAERALARYAARQRHRARRATARAALNTRLGRASRVPALKQAAVRLIVASPLRGAFARLFTMRWL